MEHMLLYCPAATCYVLQHCPASAAREASSVIRSQAKEISHQVSEVSLRGEQAIRFSSIPRNAFTSRCTWNSQCMHVGSTFCVLPCIVLCVLGMHPAPGLDSGGNVADRAALPTYIVIHSFLCLAVVSVSTFLTGVCLARVALRADNLYRTAPLISAAAALSPSSSKPRSPQLILNASSAAILSKKDKCQPSCASVAMTM